MIHVRVREREAQAKSTEPITAGSVGLQVGFRFSDDWGELAKCAVFRGSGVSIDVALLDDACAVPAEVLAQAGGHLKIGVYGVIVDENEDLAEATPTIWADAGVICEGAEPSGIEPTPQTADLVDQILAAAQASQEAAEDAAEIAQSVRDDADSGAFDGADGAPGLDGADGVSPTLDVSNITGGHRITITDANGTQTVDVMDGATGPAGADGAPGQDGAPGVGVPSGGTTGQVLKKHSDSDYDTEWANESGGGTTEVFWATYGTTTTTDMKAAKAAGKIVLVAVTQDYNDYALQLYEVADDDSCEFSGVTGSYVAHIEVTAPDDWGSLDLIEYAQKANVPSPQTSGTPADLGTAARGSSDAYARADHVHKKPTAGDVGAIPAPASPSAGDVLTYSSGAWAAAAPAHQIPAGGNAGECLAKNSSSNYDLRWRTINDWTPAGLMRTSGGTAAKVAEWSFWSAAQYPAWLVVTVGNSNTYAGAITLKVNGSTAYPIYINGAASSATNYTLPAGSYFVYFDGTKFDFRTDGKLPGDIIGHADKDIQAPASPITGDFLCWNGSAWAAKAVNEEVTISTAGAVTQALDAGKIYHFTGALTALTITLNAPASGDLAQYHFDFLSGSTAPTLTMPNTVTMPDGFTVEANKRYEVDVLNNFGAVVSWVNS